MTVQSVVHPEFKDLIERDTSSVVATSLKPCGTFVSDYVKNNLGEVMARKARHTSVNKVGSVVRHVVRSGPMRPASVHKGTG